MRERKTLEQCACVELVRCLSNESVDVLGILNPTGCLTFLLKSTSFAAFVQC